MDNGICETPKEPFPGWLPVEVVTYLSHTDAGLSLRELARRRGVHASTVLRQVRRYESRRDDPLVDQALDGLRRRRDFTKEDEMRADTFAQTKTAASLPLDAATLAREARRVFRRLSESHAVLAVSSEMERAVVLRQGPEGKAQRLCTVERSVVEAFALKDWIACERPGRIAAYRLTVAGRAALRRIEAEQTDEAFGAQHREMALREMEGAEGRMRLRVNLAESPIVMLGRKRDKDGKPYLEADLIRVAERLREDFELAQMGPRVAQNWDRFLTAGDRGGFRSDGGLAEGPRAARERVLRALADLGPGLGDVVLRVCCFVEGIETTERHMGWAARSGKIVLRIALQRLKRHYEESYGPSGPLFG